MRGSKMLKLFLVLLGVLVCSGVFADVPWTVNGPKRQIVTLVLTGNYKSPRLLAELIQNESRQPYILLPTRESGDTRIIFCPPKSNSLLIREEKFNDFVRFLNPRRIVVLGDDVYVQPKYVRMLDRTIPIVRIESNDWPRVADELTDLLNLSNLAGYYKDLRETMLNDGKIYRPISRPAAPAAETKYAPLEASTSEAAEVSDAGDSAVTPVAGEEVAPADSEAPVAVESAE